MYVYVVETNKINRELPVTLGAAGGFRQWGAAMFSHAWLVNNGGEKNEKFHGFEKLHNSSKID